MSTILEIKLYVTAAGGVVVLNGPFRFDKANEIRRLVEVAPELRDTVKNLCNVFGFGLDPVENDCAYRAIERARALIKHLEQ